MYMKIVQKYENSYNKINNSNVEILNKKNVDIK